MGEENIFGEYQSAIYKTNVYNFVEFEKIFKEVVKNNGLEDLFADDIDEEKAPSNPCKEIVKKKYVPKKISAKK